MSSFPGILMMPYSTGKTKHNSDGVSVYSDDTTIERGLSHEDHATLIPNTGTTMSMVPYTVSRDSLSFTTRYLFFFVSKKN